MRGAIFDLDGTLADTSGDLLAAAGVSYTLMREGNDETAVYVVMPMRV